MRIGFRFFTSSSIAVVAATSLVTVGCHSEQQFESVCQVVRKTVVETDDKGTASQLDVQLEWDPCPGDQIQMIRGGAEFAKCMERYKPGDYVAVRVSHYWDTRGYYEWDLVDVGGCARPIQLDTEGSYEKSQECHDTQTHGRIDGFECNRRPFAKLVKICPWMARD